MRPLNDAEKAQRRDVLAEHAVRLFAEVGYERLTVEAVAKAAGVAKGSVFLAFATKQDLVLHGAMQRFQQWFARLRELDPAVGSLARAVVETIRHDALLMPLLVLVGPVLEQGASFEAMVRFKETLGQEYARLAQAWSERLPSVPAVRWRALFPSIHAVLVGAWTIVPSPAVRAVLAPRPDLQTMVLPFEDLVLGLLQRQFAGDLPSATES